MASFNFCCFASFSLCKCHGKGDHVLIFILRSKESKKKMQTCCCLDLNYNVMMVIFPLNSRIIYSKGIYVNHDNAVRLNTTWLLFSPETSKLLGSNIHIIPGGLNMLIFFVSQINIQISTIKMRFFFSRRG